MNISLFSEKIYFTKYEEIFLNVFSFICIIVATLELFNFYRMPETVNHGAFFAAKIIFLNHVHVFFTPLFLLTTGSGKLWIKNQQHENNFLYKSLIFLVIAFFSQWVALLNINFTYTLLIIGVLAAWGAQHNIMQSYGLSKIYRHIAGETELNQSALGNRFFIPMVVLQTALLMTAFTKFDFPSYVFQLLFIPYLITMLIYIFEPALKAKKFWSVARVYDLRLLIYPLAIVSPAGVIGVLTLHGMEYFFITKKYFTNEKKSGGLINSKLFSFFCILMLITTFFKLYIIDLTTAFAYTIYSNVTVINILIAVSLTFTVYHYWVDGLLFSKRNEANRKWILKNLPA